MLLLGGDLATTGLAVGNASWLQKRGGQCSYLTALLALLRSLLSHGLAPKYEAASTSCCVLFCKRLQAGLLMPNQKPRAIGAVCSIVLEMISKWRS